MKILFVTHHYLSGNGGAVFASRAYVNAFAALYNDITLLFPSNDRKIPEEINSSVKAIPVEYNIPKIAKFIHLLIGNINRFQRIFPQLISREDFNLVVFDSSYASAKLLEKAKEKGCKTIVIHHNYQVEYAKDNTKTILKPVTLYWIAKYEKIAIKNSDLNLTLTDSDKETLVRIYDPEQVCSFATLGVFEYESKTLPAIKQKTYSGRYVITGDLSAMQTYISLSKWINDYWNHLRQSEGFTKLIIAGRNPSDVLIKLCNKNGIEIIANPISMDVVLDSANCYLCPIDMGGGLKLRIMDGLRHGLPVICHRRSLRGYESFADKAISSYENVEQFEQALKNINITPENVRKQFKEIFSFESGVGRLESIMSKYLLNEKYSIF